MGGSVVPELIVENDRSSFLQIADGNEVVVGRAWTYIKGSSISKHCPRISGRRNKSKNAGEKSDVRVYTCKIDTLSSPQ